MNKKSNVQTIIITLSVIAGLVGVVLNFIKPLERTVDNLFEDSIQRKARGEAAMERLNQLKADTQKRLDSLEKWAVSHEKEVSSIDATQSEKIKNLERIVHKGPQWGFKFKKEKQ